MFEYANSVSELAQFIIKNYCRNFNFAVDATLGNGHDTDFLSTLFSKVYSFDIQKCAIDNYKKSNKNNVKLINDSHEYIDKYIEEKIDCFIYNLGYLPGGDKSITTKANSTLNSIIKATKIINNNGIIAICMYVGHQEGEKEKNCILNFVQELSKKNFNVTLHKYINRTNNPPMLLIIEKNS
ncbi:tRNA (mnm(5)s(2)U34)-methyltransferase [Haloimpatiens sp. FM7315]|uniref:tRNA (mnm(5)s(2)U34)-methyltransferase n=1 Tax=Haloimpatiens sp. FM7315 TaxID=3298609 RepID=UPI0035A2DA26